MAVTITHDNWDSREFLLARELTEGEDANPTPATSAVILHNGESQIEVEERVLERDRPDGGAQPRVYVRRHGIVTGTIELSGAAVAGTPSPYSTVYQISGHTEVLVDEEEPDEILATDYLPILRGFPSGTGYFYHSGELQRMLAMRGIIEQMMFSIDEFNSARWRAMGEVLPITEAEVPSNVDKSAFQIPPIGNKNEMTVTLDGQELDAVSLELNNGGQLGIRYGTESTIAKHRSRVWTGTLRFWRPLIAESNIRLMCRTHAQVPLLMNYENDAVERKCSLLAPTVQLGEPRRDNADGDKIWAVPVALVNNSADYRLRFGGVIS